MSLDFQLLMKRCLTCAWLNGLRRWLLQHASLSSGETERRLLTDPPSSEARSRRRRAAPFCHLLAGNKPESEQSSLSRRRGLQPSGRIKRNSGSFCPSFNFPKFRANRRNRREHSVSYLIPVCTSQQVKMYFRHWTELCPDDFSDWNRLYTEQQWSNTSLKRSFGKYVNRFAQ